MKFPIGELVNADASLISRRCWFDSDVYALEKQAIFGRAWLFLGHESQIKNPGDFVQTFMCETPIILSRGQDHKVYANINSCSHRGLPVCRADHGNTKRFALTAYNAGPHRVDRWRNKTGDTVPVEVWIETIPYKETRNYVQTVLSYCCPTM